MNTAFGTILSSTIATAGGVVTETSHGGSQTLLDFTPTFIIVAINLLILWFMLKKLLFSKITTFMEKRAGDISRSLEEAEKANYYAEEVRAEYAEKLKQAHRDIEKMIEEAKITATKESEVIIKNAKNEATQIIVKAKIEIDKEREKMIKEVRNEVASIALHAASKVIEANLDTEANQKLVEKFISEAGVA
jgi:F-type H+-transporting ATPase subunit b